MNSLTESLDNKEETSNRLDAILDNLKNVSATEIEALIEDVLIKEKFFKCKCFLFFQKNSDFTFKH
jgi:hypothetical protein